jgi:hypothetical protein
MLIVSRMATFKVVKILSAHCVQALMLEAQHMEVEFTLCVQRSVMPAL